MSILPDELWRRILEIGIKNSILSYKDLCCLSITCTTLHRISAEDSFWVPLLSSDFRPQTASISNPLLDSPSSSSSSASPANSKAVYKIRYERNRQQKLLAHRRIVLRFESEIALFKKKIRDLEHQFDEERERMRTAAAELSNLYRIRQASVALNVWQPNVIQGRQKEIVEQCDVSIESRTSALEMELRLCKKQIAIFDKALNSEKGKLETAKEKLASVEYHPLHGFTSSIVLFDNTIAENSMTRKKLKHISSFLHARSRSCLSHDTAFARSVFAKNFDCITSSVAWYC